MHNTKCSHTHRIEKFSNTRIRKILNVKPQQTLKTTSSTPYSLVQDSMGWSHFAHTFPRQLCGSGQGRNVKKASFAIT